MSSPETSWKVLSTSFQIICELITSLTRVGWKVHRLTKKKLSHSDDTWYVLNSTFHDSNCIVFFQIHVNPHWISNSGLSNVVLETFHERPVKLIKGVLFHNAPAHNSVVAMAVVHVCGFEMVDHPPYSPDLAPSDYFLFPNMKIKVIVLVKQDSLCQFSRLFTKCL